MIYIDSKLRVNTRYKLNSTPDVRLIFIDNSYKRYGKIDIDHLEILISNNMWLLTKPPRTRILTKTIMKSNGLNQIKEMNNEDLDLKRTFLPSSREVISWPISRIKSKEIPT